FGKIGRRRRREIGQRHPGTERETRRSFDHHGRRREPVDRLYGPALERAVSRHLEVERELAADALGTEDARARRREERGGGSLVENLREPELDAFARDLRLVRGGGASR